MRAIRVPFANVLYGTCFGEMRPDILVRPAVKKRFGSILADHNER